MGKDPPKEALPMNIQWSTSITHAMKGACPYPGASAWGVVLDISKEANFWKFFEQSKSGKFCGQCTDGYKCGEGNRFPIPDWSYEKFAMAKNEIVAQTGTNNCHIKHASAYNEFSTNGLSSRALAGLFIPECL